MSSINPKGGSKQDIGGVFGQHGLVKQNPAQEMNANQIDAGTPLEGCCGTNVTVNVPSGSPFAQSTLTSTPLGFDHFDGVATTTSILFPNTVAGSIDYTTPTIVDNLDGSLTATFTDGTALPVNVCDIIGTYCNSNLSYNMATNTILFTDNTGSVSSHPLTINCEFTVNAGPTALATDNANGEEVIGCGDTLHFWSNLGTLDFNIAAGSAIIEGDVNVASTQPQGTNLIQVITGQGLYAPTPVADGVTIIGTGAINDPFVAASSASGLFSCADLVTCSLGNLGDVDVTTVVPASGQVLFYDGGGWVPGSNMVFNCNDLNTCSVNDIGDIDTLTAPPTSGEVLGWNGTNFVPTPRFVCTDLNACSLDALSDIDTTTTPPASGQVLFYDGTGWVPGSNMVFQCSDLNTCSADDIGDIDTTTVAPASGQVLAWDGTNWIPGAGSHRVVYVDNTGSDYDDVTDPGSTNRPVVPIEGDEVIELYDNGLLKEIYDGTQWVSVFSTTCCPGPTRGLTDGILGPADAEVPTNAEIQAFYNALAPADQGTGTQITYTSPNGSYFTWIVDVAGTAIPHEQRFIGGSGPAETIDATTAASQLAFDALLPTAFPEGYENLHAFVTMGASDFSLDNFVTSYAKPQGVTSPVLHVHNTGTAGGNILYTMPVTGTVISFGQDDIITLDCDGAGNWIIRG